MALKMIVWNHLGTAHNRNYNELHKHVVKWSKLKISRIVVIMHPGDYCDVDNDWQIEMPLFITFRDDYLR